MWAAAAATALFWGLKLFVTPAPLPARTPVAAPAALARGDLTRLLGVDAAPAVAEAAAEPPPDARFQLLGVVSPRSRQSAAEGLAVIAVDGKPARAYRVGAVVDGQTVLQSVGARGAQLGPRGGASLVALNLAPPAAAATGTLPGVNNGNPSFLPPQVPPQPQPQAMPPMSSNVPPPAAPAPPGYGQPVQPAGPQGQTRRVVQPPMAPVMPMSPRGIGQVESSTH
jgi:general secretion pathway protein C